MVKIESNQTTSALKALFRTDDPLPARCPSVLAGTAVGKIITDDPVNPTWGIVQELFDGCIYFGGTPDAATVAQVIAHLRRERMVLAPFWPADPRQHLLPPAPDYDGYSIDFYARPIGQGLDRFLNAVPVGCTVQRADRELILRTEWGPGDVQYHGGLAAWEQKCICYCLLSGDEVLSEASVGAGVYGLREPGVFTQEKQRGKGYGTIVSAYLIQEIETVGDRTYWSCDQTNVASAAIGRKLGYQTEKEFRVLGWRKTA